MLFFKVTVRVMYVRVMYVRVSVLAKVMVSVIKQAILLENCLRVPRTEHRTTHSIAD